MERPIKAYELNGPMYFDGSTFFNTGCYMLSEDVDWTILLEFKAVREYHENPRYVWSCNDPYSSYGIGYPIVKFDHRIDINDTISQLTDCPGGTTVNYRRLVIKRRGNRIKVFVNFVEDHCYVFRQSREFKYEYSYSYMPIILGARIINDIPQNYFNGTIHTFVVFKGEVDDDTCIDYVDREIDVPNYDIVEPDPEPEPEPEPEPDVSCSSLSFTRDSVDINVGEYIDLNNFLIVKPDNCTDEVTWVADSDIVDHNNGFIVGLRQGSLRVKANCGKLTASILVNINNTSSGEPSDKHCTSINFNVDTITLFINDIIDLNQFLVIRPTDCTDSIIWDIDSHLLANNNGRVKALIEGSTKVKATCGGLSDTVNVIIKSNNSSEPDTGERPCTSLTFNKDNINLLIGESIDLNQFLVIKPADCTDDVKWEVDTDLLANSKGRVTAIDEGATKVIARCGDLSASIKITITDLESPEPDTKPCTSITFTKDVVDIKVGEYIDLNEYLKIRPSDCTDIVFWDVDEELLGNSNGFIKGLAEGSTKVRAICGDLYATIKVNIIDDTNDGGGSNPDSIPCTSIAFTQDVLEMLIGETFNLNTLLVIKPLGCTDDIIWTIDTEILTHQKGIVKALAKGSVKVRVDCGDLSASMTINVNAIEEPEDEIRPCTSISFTRNEVIIYVEEMVDLNAYIQVKPNRCTDSVIWTVDEELLENNNGAVKGLQEGSTIVKASCGSLYATIRVVIKGIGTFDPPEIGGDIVVDPNPKYERAISYLERVKLDDGSYVIKLPITSANEVIYNLETGETIHQIFNDALRAVQAESYTLLEDFALLVGKIAGLVDDNIVGHHIYRDNMKTNDNITVVSGRFNPGSVSNGTDNKLTFHMKNPLVLKDKPIKLQLKDIKHVVGDIKINIKVTFNALDDEPIWIDYTDYYNQGKFLPLTVDYAAKKQKDVDWAINFIFEAERVTNMGSIEVVDFILLHL